MGASASRTRRIIWCDTEGGTKNVPLWDVSFIEDEGSTVRATRFCSVTLAHQKGKTALRRNLPAQAFQDCTKKNTTCVVQYTLDDNKHAWKQDNVAVADTSLNTLVAAFLLKQNNCIVAAWNMKAHDRHVLKRSVGEEVLSKLRLWDALIWFRAHYSLPKNTLSSNRAGTPRAVFEVPVYGKEHSSLVDAAHLREVVRRAAYSFSEETKLNMSAWKTATQNEISVATHNHIEDDIDKRTLLSVWTVIPKQNKRKNKVKHVQQPDIS